MTALKIKLYQKTANYCIGGSITNRMSYPLPPFSAILGMIHTACDWDSYHDLGLSVHGKYESSNRTITRYHSVMSGTYEDRGILFESSDSGIFSEFSSTQIANFNEDSINKNLLLEFKEEKQALIDLKNFYKQKIDSLKDEKKKAQAKLKTLEKKSNEYQSQKTTIEKLAQTIKDIELERNAQVKLAENKLQRYISVTSHICETEILYDINLIVYVSGSEDDLREIYRCAYNISHLGRSEDFVKVLSCDFVELITADDEFVHNSEYATYIDYSLVANRDVILNQSSVETAQIRGTVYRIPKQYKIENGLRIFDKKKVMLLNHFLVDDVVDNLFIDNTEPKPLIVNMI